MNKIPHLLWIQISAALIALALPLVGVAQPPAEAQGASPATSVPSAHTQIHALKVTLLS